MTTVRFPDIMRLTKDACRDLRGYRGELRLTAQQRESSARSARRIEREGAERWATGARTYWSPYEKPERTVVLVPSERRLTDQWGFEHILITIFNYRLPEDKT